LFNP